MDALGQQVHRRHRLDRKCGALCAGPTAIDAVLLRPELQKNTVNLFAKTSPHVLVPELFALDLGVHFVTKYVRSLPSSLSSSRLTRPPARAHAQAHLHRCSVDVVQLKWSRIAVQGKPHPWSFVRNGEDKRTASVVVDATQGKDKITATCKAGLKDLLVLKTHEVRGPPPCRGRAREN